jgi:serine/threonine protein kinase
MLRSLRDRDGAHYHALHVGHAAGIVHRDLKPDNVLYDPESHHVRLLDIGSAADTETAPDERLGPAGFFVGTLTYVAPEALSSDAATPHGDTFASAELAR